LNSTTFKHLKLNLKGFHIPPGYGPFLFFLALSAYIVVLLGNGVVVCVIVLDKNLHRPMFIMICHLLVCDLLGATTVLPRLMMHFLLGQKKIAYASAIAQAYCVHTYATAMHTILGVMAYDRYVAVCEPLRYHTIMTSARLHSCCALAWIVAVLIMAVLLSFHKNVPLCGRTIQHVYCSNRGILNLACIPTPMNNIYGRYSHWELGFMRVSFCVSQAKSCKPVRSKAFQTCAPHIVVYVLYEVATLIVVVSYRFPSLSQNIKKFFSILVYIIPPVINPIIYGLVSKDLRSSFVKRFSQRVRNKI
uniref:G-protein coupled receptors family 1 profile domain-containing protein n=1 Tax=Kryptolebias marmoratus TaxID=37003 RepID=A0A3Q3FHE9_KRYMA